MNDAKPISQEEYEDLLKEFPKLQQFSSQLQTIASLKADTKEEKDPAMLTDTYETILRLQERLYAKMVTYISEEHVKQFNGMEDNCRGWKANAEKMEAALKEERQVNDEIFDNMCMLMMIDPRGTFESIILKQVERKKKIEGGDGYGNWQWGLHFPLIARLRMAFKLIFGRKEPQKK